MKINCINRLFIKLKVKGMASLCSHYFIGYVGLPSRTTGISGSWDSILHGSISEQYLCLTSAIETRVCQHADAMHDPRPSDVHIGEEGSPCIITE